MIKETAVFVGGNHQQRLVPFRAINHCLHHLSDQALPVCNIGRRAIVIAGRNINEVGVNKRDRR